MITRIDLRGRTLTRRELLDELPRAEVDVEHAAEVVAPILADVRKRGAAELRDLAERFDGVRPVHLRVPADVIAASVGALDPDVRSALDETIRRVRLVHAAQRPADFTVDVVPGAQVRQRWVPVRRVGLYVPGGLAVYPSSVVMNVVAAQEAGVGVARRGVAAAEERRRPARPGGARRRARCWASTRSTPWAARRPSRCSPTAPTAATTSTARSSASPSTSITGPGNVYVAAAKRLVRGVVGIDAEAGPTEIAILADGTADASHVAADLVSQAEHDPLAAAVLVTPSVELAGSVEAKLVDRVEATEHRGRVTTALSGKQSAIVLVDDLEQGLEVVNAYGAEHLEIQTVGAAELAERVTSAGAIFVGPYSPVSLGDYMAGSNHVLPTGGCAHFTSGLGVHSFLRAVQVIEYDADALAEVADRIVALADAEGLPAHGEAVRARF